MPSFFILEDLSSDKSVVDSAETVRILIVDDEAELREILVEQLSDLTVQVGGIRYPIEIETATDGREALEKFKNTNFDTILTDINMPAMNGLELVGALRGAGSDTPSIFLTGFCDKPKAVEAIRLGCFGFLDKPWKVFTLRKMVAGALERGIGLRRINHQVNGKLDEFTKLDKAVEIDEIRERQLRTVFRSMLVGGDGSHRSDVCPVPDLVKPSGKKAA